MFDNTFLSTGPLAGLFPILSLRTLKADVAVGLTDDLAKALDVKDPKWRVNGKQVIYRSLILLDAYFNP